MLNKWRVMRDLTVCQYYGTDDRALTGSSNEGVIVEAPSERNAVIQWCRKHQKNPFYYKAILA